ncbi:nuclear transport factor 2 family protein [Cryptosporangium sp. NPDC051539]|uniref:nuclear transport factor 2 family protein n=1 Tax=Cryptosporangium sp. NPDC051539 TaxID=3363962 RepID=UPI0037A7C39E
MDLAARVSLRGLVDLYAFACDRRDGDGFAALFAPDASLVVHWPGRTPSVITELAQVPVRLGRYDRTFHFVGNHLVSVLRGDDAAGDAYCLAHHVTGADDKVIAIHYEDRYRRVGDDWRFARRDVRVQWIDDRKIGS